MSDTKAKAGWELVISQDKHEKVVAQLKASQDKLCEIKNLCENCRSLYDAICIAAGQEVESKCLNCDSEKLKAAQDEVERLEQTPRCPCNGVLEGVGVDRGTQDNVYNCKKCDAQLIIARQALKPKAQDKESK